MNHEKKNKKQHLKLCGSIGGRSSLFLIVLLIGEGMEWLSEKTGWPIYTAVTIAGIFYAAWLISKSFTKPDKMEE